LLLPSKSYTGSAAEIFDTILLPQTPEFKFAWHAGGAVTVREADPDICGWGSLPLELKEIIWGQCSVPQLARVATTCKEFCDHFRALRGSLKTLTLPSGDHRENPQIPELGPSRTIERLFLCQPISLNKAYVFKPLHAEPKSFMIRANVEYSDCLPWVLCLKSVEALRRIERFKYEEFGSSYKSNI
jgi:hypothetical protein